MSWRRWPWLEEGALPLSLVLLRLFWLWPWLLLIERWTLPPEMRPVLPLWLMAALLVGGALAARLLTTDADRHGRARYWAAALGLGVMLLTLWWRLERTQYALWDPRWVADQAITLTHWGGVIPISVAVLGLTAYLWLRGMQDSAAPNHDDIWRAFSVGFLALVLLLIVARFDPAGPPPAITRWIVLFFAVGMAALALAGLRLARGFRDTSGPLPANRYWAGSIAALVIVLLGGGLLLAFVITPDGVARAMGWMNRVVAWVAQILGYIFYGLVYVMFLFLTPLIYWLEKHIGDWFAFDTARLQGMQQGIMEMAEQPETVVLPSAVDETLRWTGLAVALVVVALAFAAALHLLRKRGEVEEDEVRETVLTQALLLDQANALWQRWRNRLRWNGDGATSPFLPLVGEPATRQRVRAAYQAFLAAMVAQAIPRARAQTPHGYAETARAVIPSQARAVDALTSKYVAARYDSTEPLEEDAVTAESALDEIRRGLTDSEQ